MKKRGRKRRREQRKKKNNNNLTLALLYWPVLLAARPPGLSHQAVVSVQQEVDQSSETRARSVPTRRQKLPRALGRQLLLTQVHIIHTQVCCYIYTQAWEKRHEDKKTCRTQLITPLGYRWFIWMWFSPRLFNAFSQFSSWVPQEFYIHTLTLNVNREMLHRCLPPRLGGCSTPSWISSPSHAASSSGILTRTTGKLSPCQRVSVYASRQQWGLSYSFVVVLSIENERLIYLLVIAVTSARYFAALRLTSEETPSAGLTEEQPAQEGDGAASHSLSVGQTHTQSQKQHVTGVGNTTNMVIRI